MSTMTIWAECTVSAAHHFNGYGMHGHTYLVRVSVRSEHGAWIDAEKLYALLAEVRKGVDHRCLNDVLEVPSMEELARWFGRHIGEHHDVAEVAISRAEGVGCVLRLPEAERSP